jgi:hypothetical protein
MDQRTVWRKTATTRKPEEWQALLAAIEDPSVRIKVANCVFFDYMPNETDPHGNPIKAGPEWNFLRQFVEQYDPSNTPSLQDEMHGLIAVGYPESMAYQRVSEDKRKGAEESLNGAAKRNPGVEELLSAVCVQAVDDVKALKENHIIEGGMLRPGWFHKGGAKIRDYDKPYEVDELLDFVTEGGLQTLFDILGVKREAESVIELLGLGRKADRKRVLAARAVQAFKASLAPKALDMPEAPKLPKDQAVAVA